MADLFHENMSGSEFVDACRIIKKKNKYQKTFPMFSTPVPRLPDGWVWSCISEISERVSVGHVGPTSEFFPTREEGIPFARSQDVRPGRLEIQNVRFITPAFHDKLKKSQLKAGDVLIVRVGANRGDACEVPKGIEHLNCANIVFARPIEPNGFAAFYFRSSFGRKMLLSVTTGSAQGVLNTQTVARLPIPIPPLKTQRKVAAILATYDRLIENNKQRAALLERVAEEIYREWFVRFRFPNHKNTSFTKGIPNDWKQYSFREIVSYYIGGGWGEEHESNTFSEPAYVIRGTDIPKINDGKFESVPFRFHTPSNLKSRKLRPFDFVFEVAGGSKGQLLGRNLMITPQLTDEFGEDVMCASFCKQMRFDESIVSPYFMKYFLKLYHACDLVGMFQVQSTGISNYQFESFLTHQRLHIPTPRLQKEFEDCITPIVDQQLTLQVSNSKLRHSRDFLLGRLVSGSLSLDEIEVATPPELNDEDLVNAELVHA